MIESAFGVIHKAGANPFKVIRGGLDGAKVSGGSMKAVPNSQPFSASPKKFFSQQHSSLRARETAKYGYNGDNLTAGPASPMRSSTKSGKTFPGRWVRTG